MLVVDRNEIRLVSEAGPCNELGSHVERNRNEHVVFDLAFVIGHELLVVRVDALEVEVGLEADVLLFEEVPE